ncbi:MAG: DUF1559 domain-containing protein [Planctomycetota bacterium]
MKKQRLAMTLVELLVVIAIIGILVALLLPAVQMARESSRRVACANNVRQLGIATLNFHDSKGEFPRSMVFFPSHGWAPDLLPFIEEQSLHDIYDFDAMWNSPSNHRAIGTSIPTLLCPSSPVEPYDIQPGFVAAATDYSPASHVSPGLMAARLIDRIKNLRGVVDNRRTTLRQVKDGTTKTILFAEDAGRPEFFVAGQKGPEFNQPGGGNLPVEAGRVRGAGWASPANEIPLHGFTADGLRSPGPCAINCTNNNEAYSFHPGGVSGVFADGHYEFLSEETEIRVYSAMITRAGGDELVR